MLPFRGSFVHTVSLIISDYTSLFCVVGKARLTTDLRALVRGIRSKRQPVSSSFTGWSGNRYQCKPPRKVNCGNQDVTVGFVSQVKGFIFTTGSKAKETELNAKATRSFVGIPALVLSFTYASFFPSVMIYNIFPSYFHPFTTFL